MSGKPKKTGSKPSSPVPSSPVAKVFTHSDVSEALTARSKGYPNQVESIVKQLQSKDAAALIPLLLALKQTVSLLGLDNRDVVLAALKVHWTGSDEVTDAFGDFIEHLVSAHTVYVRQVCDSLAQYFLPDEGEDQPDGDGEAGVRTRGEEAHNVYRRTHLVLYRVVQVVPASPSILSDILKGFFPHKRRSALRHEVYLRNLLTVTSYVPSLRDAMLQIAIHRMLKIDVEITEHEQMIEEEDEEDGEDGAETGDGDAAEPMEMQVDEGIINNAVDGHTDLKASSHQLSGQQLALVSGDSVQEAAAEQTRSSIQPVLSEMAHKLDRMMCVLFEYLEVALTGHGDELSRSEKAEANAALFALLLTIFEEIILPTHKTRYVQFLLFRVCSVDRDLPAVFVSFLKLKLFNARNSIVDRQAAACYLASFVARHDKVSDQVAADVLESMSQWCLKYIAAYDDKCSVTHVNLSAHGVFYVVCQAIMYIFCFRHHALLEKNGLTWVRKLRFSKIVSSNLNPLKVVLPHLTQEFARITRKEEIVYCYSIINRNERIVLSSKVGLGDKRLLEAYFPFDPYNLRDSAKHVTDYVEWAAPDDEDVLDEGLESGDDDLDEDEDGSSASDDSGDDSDDEGSDSETPMGGSYGSDAMAMSVTPDDAAFLMAFQRNVTTTRSTPRTNK